MSDVDMCKRIAIVSYRYNLAIGSMTNSFIWMLAEKGYCIDIYIDTHSFTYCSSFLKHERINWCLFDGEKPLDLFDKILNKTSCCDKIFRLLPLKKITKIFSRQLFAFSEWVQKKLCSEKYDLYIAVEARALATMHWYSGIKLIYLNLELLSCENDSWIFPHKQLLKHIECELLNRVQQVFITSPLRGDIFSEINKFPRDKVDILPVVPLRGAVNSSSQFFRKKFNISDEKRIVLYAGHIVEWARCDEIIRSVASWPSDCELVMHTWSKKSVPPDFLKRLKVLASGHPVHFSFESIPYERVSDAWASADIGLAFYAELDDNFTEILFSSNKIGEYMKAGLPIVCSDFPSLRKFVDEHQIGRSINISELSEAIANVLSGYEDYKSNVASCHEKYFVFEKYFDDIYPKILKIMAQDENFKLG